MRDSTGVNRGVVLHRRGGFRGGELFTHAVMYVFAHAPVLWLLGGSCACFWPGADTE
jgi:hypothetical protein